jgi:hypothetical protein
VLPCGNFWQKEIFLFVVDTIFFWQVYRILRNFWHPWIKVWKTSAKSTKLPWTLNPTHGKKRYLLTWEANLHPWDQCCCNNFYFLRWNPHCRIKGNPKPNPIYLFLLLHFISLHFLFFWLNFCTCWTSLLSSCPKIASPWNHLLMIHSSIQISLMFFQLLS